MRITNTIQTDVNAKLYLLYISAVVIMYGWYITIQHIIHIPCCSLDMMRLENLTFLRCVGDCRD